ncbi:protein-L-isoaspartate O-methyltransferase [Methylocella sp.]|uniref:protein-L-isoaspartate O-methyltransferase n=1 Tax=Methylocella sp. TaxID=1978226 RepID=UPI0037830C7A
MQDEAVSGALADPSAELRRTMVDRQIKTFDVTDAAVLARMLEVPRERFLPERLFPLAYSDAALPLEGEGGARRTLLPPLVLARLIQGARIEPTDRVLVVAAAPGYSTALVAGLAAETTALESDSVLAAALRANLESAGLGAVKVIEAPLVAGASARAPFDVILVDGAVAARLDPLLDQLAEGGRLVAIQRLDDGSSKAVRHDRAGGAVGARILFDAVHPTLEEFRAADAFTFT